MKNLVLKYFCEDNDGQTAWTGTIVYLDAYQTPTKHTIYLKWNIKTSKTCSEYIKFQIKMHYVFHSKKGYEDEMDALYKIFT